MISVVGLSHRTAPIVVRERFALDERAASDLMCRLVADPEIGESVVLSTCNRVEVFVVPREGVSDEASAKRALELTLGSHQEHRGHFYRLVGQEGLGHLFRLAASLDSMVLGEPQILGQVKQAFDRARALGTLGPCLLRASVASFKAAKRVRSETGIGRGQVSVATVALDLARQIFDDLDGRQIALIGTGEMGIMIARLLTQEGAVLSILGRSRERVEDVAGPLGANSRTLEELGSTLRETDVVIAGTSAPHAIVSYQQVKEAMRLRRTRDLFMLDVSVPRNIAPEVERLEGVYLYNIDDLSILTQEASSQRQKSAKLAEKIIEEELVQCEVERCVEPMVPLLRSLHRSFEATLRAEVARSLKGKLQDLSERERNGLEQMVLSAANKLLARPSQRLREIARQRPLDVELTRELLMELFDLDLTKSPDREVSPAVESSGDKAMPSANANHEDVVGRAESGGYAAISSSPEEPS